MAGTALKVSAVVILLIFLNFAGVVAWLYYRSPARFAGIERNPATAPPAVYEQPPDEGSPTRRELLAMLRNREFSELTSVVDAKHALVVRDIRNESELHRVLQTFEINDPAITTLLDEWIAATPASPAPHVASAVHLNSRAYAARGGRLAADTTDEQFTGMYEFLTKSITAATAAIERDPRHTQAYRTLINAVRAQGDQAACGEFARQGLTAMPASLRIRWALVTCRLPRWGGSHAAIERIWEQARPFVADHPALSVLQGAVAWDLARIAEGDEALRRFDKAVASGPFSVYFFDRAREHMAMKNAAAALEDVQLALALTPEDPVMLDLQLKALADLGRHREASATLTILEEVDATYATVQEWRDYLRNATDRAAAQQSYANGYELYKAGDKDGALAAFLAHIRRNPSDFNAHLAIDIILAERRDWDGIIAQWSGYLMTHPNDGRAFLERGGAQHRKGSIDAARSDIETACRLDVAKACDIAKRQGWQ